MNTCLFTGDVLDETTKIEHTILRSIGGKIRSTEVCSSEFNGLCGSTIDQNLHDCYSEICRILAPFISKEHQQGCKQITIGEDEKYFILDTNNILKLKGCKVVERDENGKPQLLYTNSKAKALEMAKQLNIPEDSLSITYERPTNENVFYFNKETVSTDMEISLLKCALLSYDHLLKRSIGKFVFTRDKSLKDIYAIINNSLDNLETRQIEKRKISHVKIDKEKWHSISLGIQYDKLEMINEIRSEISFNQTPFEHFLIASGNSSTKTIDIIFNIFNHEPWGFRVSNNWEGEDFQYCIINPIFKNEAASDIFEISKPSIICNHTDFRAVPGSSTQEDIQEYKKKYEKIIKLISNERIKLQQKANIYTELNAKDFIWEQIESSSKMNKHSISEEAKNRIERLYYLNIEDKITNDINSKFKVTNINKFEDNKDVFMDTYIKILRYIIEIYGEGNNIFSNKLCLEIEMT